MTTYDFILNNIGSSVYITGDRDLAFNGELKPLIQNKTELTIVKLTKKGMALLTDGKKTYSVPPSNVREIGQ